MSNRGCCAKAGRECHELAVGRREIVGVDLGVRLQSEVEQRVEGNVAGIDFRAAHLRRSESDLLDHRAREQLLIGMLENVGCIPGNFFR